MVQYPAGLRRSLLQRRWLIEPTAFWFEKAAKVEFPLGYECGRAKPKTFGFGFGGGYELLR